MNKRGFTLIELLALIGLLTIIILLATPNIIHQIESQKEKNYENFLGDLCLSAEAYINHADNIEGIDNFKVPGDYIMISMNDLITNGYIKSSTKNPKTKENIKTTDNILVTINSNKTYTCELNGVPAYTVYSPGDLIQFDPVSNSKCTTGSTCYKWRVITVGDTVFKTNITLQMDHNLINTGAWSPSNTSTGPSTALSSLATATSSWTISKLTYSYDTRASANNYGILTCTNGTCVNGSGTTIATNVKARMITGEEIRALTLDAGAGENTLAYEWSLSSNSATTNPKDYYYANKNYLIGTKTSGTGSLELNWMVENITDNAGSEATPNAYGEKNYGYWSMSPVNDSSSRAWIVFDGGDYGSSGLAVSSTAYFGVRPVITISKISLE